MRWLCEPLPKPLPKIPPDPIAHHQEPASEALAEEVEFVAGRDLHRGHHADVERPIDLAPQLLARLHFPHEAGAGEAYRAAAALHEHPYRGSRVARGERQPDHAFPADHADFQRVAGRIVSRLVNA